jgi:ATP-binding protein involved in chromosome partitioning
MEARIDIIDKRLSSIKRIISVASGKGGVGKSLVASSLALNLSKKGYKVGLLDLDLYGPSSHIILGVNDYKFPEEEKGIIPPKIDGINFISIVYYTEDKPSPFRGVDISNIIIEILAITQWGELDYLIIDMPPGIGDETLDVIRLVKRSEFLIVSTPSIVAIGAVNKLLRILKELKLPIIGIIENMKMKKSNLVKDRILEMDLKYLGDIMFDHNLEEAIGNIEKLNGSDFMKDFDKIIKKNI